VYTIHGDFFENKALKKSKDILMPLILGRRRRVTAISSEPVKPKWLLGRVSIIPNGIDPGPVVARSSKEDPTLGPILELKRKGFNPVILFPGQVIRRKGHEFALLAMREILATHPKAALVVVGEGPDRPYLEDLARKTGVQDSVFFLGYAANQYPAMANADVLLSHLTSQWPLPSLVELEGIALKKQVITLGTPEKRSLYDDSVIFLEREDNSELERAVNSALTKGEAARRIKNGEAVLRKLSWDSIASTYLQLYANVIGLKQPRST
jgi:glycosyltransferase involved in cell wall biosynthesis